MPLNISKNRAMVLWHDFGDVSDAKAADEPCEYFSDKQLVFLDVVIVFELEQIVENLLGDFTLLLQGGLAQQIKGDLYELHHRPH